MRIPLVSATFEEDDKAAMIRAVERGAIEEGDLAQKLAAEFARNVGALGGLATSSGTTALILALKTLRVNDGDEVILPTFTCLSVLNAVVMSGGSPVLVDVNCDPERMDYNMSEKNVRGVLTRRTRAIIVPHMFGVPAEIDSIVRLGVPVIEDATLSLGAFYRNRPVGGWGAVSICSLHASKMIAAGEGGVLTTSDRRLLDRARYLAGWREELAKARVSAAPRGGYELRFNFHLNDVSAALGLSQLRKLRRFVAKRKTLAKRYSVELRSLPGLVLPDTPSNDNVFFRYLVFRQGHGVLEVLEKFTRRCIEVGRGVFPPLHAYLGLSPALFPNATRLTRGLLSIPLYPSLGEEQVTYLMRVAREVLSSR